jgi:hypothetical protein
MNLLIKATARNNKVIAIVRGCAKASIKGLHAIPHHLSMALRLTSGLTTGLTSLRGYCSESMWQMERVLETVWFGTPIRVPNINHTQPQPRVNQSSRSPRS